MIKKADVFSQLSPIISPTLAKRESRQPRHIPHSDDPPQVHRKIGEIEILNPQFDLGKIKVIVWDMDGTLYSQDPMVEHYREALRNALPEQLRSMYDEKSCEVIRGTSLFRVGHSYDPRHKLIVRKNRRGEVVYAYTAKGTRISMEQLHRLYPGRVKGDEGIIHIDNKLKALQVLGVAFGKTMQEVDHLYFEVRNKYFQELNGKNPSPGLPDFLAFMKVKGHLHLISTVAPLQGAQQMLRFLEVLDHFHKIHTGVAKPHGMKGLVHDIMKEHGVRPEEILSIGNESAMDHLVPKELGVQTLLVAENPGQNVEGADAVVPSLMALMRSFEKLHSSPSAISCSVR